MYKVSFKFNILEINFWGHFIKKSSYVILRVDRHVIQIWVTAMFLWGPSHPQLGDAFLRLVEQNFTNNLQHFFYIIFNTSI